MTVTPSSLRALPMSDGAARFTPYASGRFPFAQFDYVEEEWLASGIADGQPYETVVLVRMPRDRSKFSGTVLVEPLHVHGITPMALYSSTYIMREGHGWAMVASQRSTVIDHVRPANPDRYASVHIAGADTATPELALTATDELRGFWQTLKAINSASSTILAQVGAALRSGVSFGERAVGHLLLMGHSQTGSVVTYYLAEAHHAQRLADGSAVYDGYCPTGYPAGAFGPCEVPIVQIMSDGDVSNPAGTFVPGFSRREYRRDDSDDPSDRFRLYELAAVPHMGTRYAPFDDPELWRATRPEAEFHGAMVMNTLPHNELFNACLHHLVEWVVADVVPPRAERITTKPDGWFAIDEHGNSTGGVRCVQIDVPRARYFPNLPLADGSLSIHTVGTEVPFDAVTMTALYGSGEGYQRRFEERVQQLVSEGWLLADDVEYMRDDLGKVPHFGS